MDILKKYKIIYPIRVKSLFSKPHRTKKGDLSSTECSSQDNLCGQPSIKYTVSQSFSKRLMMYSWKIHLFIIFAAFVRVMI